MIRQLATIPDDAEPLGDLAMTLGVSPATLYQAGCRSELPIFKVMGRWVCSRAAAEAYVVALKTGADR
jgi:hypothetical protein